MTLTLLFSFFTQPHWAFSYTVYSGSSNRKSSQELWRTPQPAETRSSQKYEQRCFCHTTSEQSLYESKAGWLVCLISEVYLALNAFFSHCWTEVSMETKLIPPISHRLMLIAVQLREDKHELFEKSTKCWKRAMGIEKNTTGIYKSIKKQINIKRKERDAHPKHK